MDIAKTSGWNDYELIDTGDGYRLEKFGKYILSRPDPQIIWKKKLSETIWKTADAVFERLSDDKGKWIKKKSIPDKWLVNYKNLSFFAKLTPFKHTGIFPEQHLQWDWISDQLSVFSSQKKVNQSSVFQSDNLKTEKLTSENREQKTDNRISILNLFAYTGIATLAAAGAGAKVTHVDASYPTIGWARENQTASNLASKPIRWIQDDCIKFVEREIKRGVKYDGIIMDPPAFGHGPDGKAWKFNFDFPRLMNLCKQVLSDNPLFIVVNAYAISSSALMLKNVLEDYLDDLNGKIEVGELVLEEKQNKRLLSTGIFARWSIS